jgi:hypothetical protein
MQSLNKNGVSITQTPGEEKFVKCRLGAFRGQIYYQSLIPQHYYKIFFLST